MTEISNDTGIRIERCPVGLRVGAAVTFHPSLPGSELGAVFLCVGCRGILKTWVPVTKCTHVFVLCFPPLSSPTIHRSSTPSFSPPLPLLPLFFFFFYFFFYEISEIPFFLSFSFKLEAVQNNLHTSAIARNSAFLISDFLVHYSFFFPHSSCKAYKKLKYRRADILHRPVVSIQEKNEKCD